MRQVSDFPLWFSHHADAVALARSNPLGIEAIVDLAANEPAVPVHRDTVYCRIPLIDGAENASEILRLAVNSVESLIRAGVPTLVCCSAGMSRSPAVAAAALSRVRQVPLSEALAVVASEGGDVSPAFLNQLADVLQGKR